MDVELMVCAPKSTASVAWKVSGSYVGFGFGMYLWPRKREAYIIRIWTVDFGAVDVQVFTSYDTLSRL